MTAPPYGTGNYRRRRDPEPDRAQQAVTVFSGPANHQERPASSGGTRSASAFIASSRWVWLTDPMLYNPESQREHPVIAGQNGHVWRWLAQYFRNTIPQGFTGVQRPEIARL